MENDAKALIKLISNLGCKVGSICRLLFLFQKESRTPPAEFSKV